MDMQTIPRRLGFVAALALASMAGSDDADAGGRHHRHDDGVSGFFTLDFTSPVYGYYDPYPYAPAYVYPPGYAYAPPYEPYDDGPLYDDGAYRYAPPYRSVDGSYCREFQTTVVIDGRPERAFGTACLQPDGSWAVVN